MAFYYLVAAVPVEDGVTADVPAGVSWCGNTDGASYLVRTVDSIPEAAELFPADPPEAPAWQTGEAVEVDDRREYQGIVYRCIQAHTTQANWKPPNTESLWTVARQDGDPWVQPTMAEDAYNTGDIVLHNDLLWKSKIDANTTEPGSDDRWWEQGSGVIGKAQELIAAGAAFAERDPLDRWRLGGL